MEEVQPAPTQAVHKLEVPVAVHAIGMKMNAKPYCSSTMRR